MDMHGEGPEINQNSLFVPVLDVSRPRGPPAALVLAPTRALALLGQDVVNVNMTHGGSLGPG